MKFHGDMAKRFTRTTSALSPRFYHDGQCDVRVRPASAARGLASWLRGRLVVFFVRHAHLGAAEATRALQLYAHGFIAPDFLEVVVLAQRRLEDMDDSVAAIDQHPLADLFAFGADDVAAQPLDLVAHAVGERLGLTIRRAARDDDTVEEGGQVGGVEHLDVLRLDVFETVDDRALKLCDFHIFTDGTSGVEQYSPIRRTVHDSRRLSHPPRAPAGVLQTARGSRLPTLPAPAPNQSADGRAAWLAAPQPGRCARQSPRLRLEKPLRRQIRRGFPRTRAQIRTGVSSRAMNPGARAGRRRSKATATRPRLPARASEPASPRYRSGRRDRFHRWRR